MRDETQYVRFTANQLASSLMVTLQQHRGATAQQMAEIRFDLAKVHFHDGSQTPIAWNNVQAIQGFNAVTGEGLPVPAVATEGYNQHYHTSQFDGGLIPGTGLHDHRDNFNSGFAFAIYHPGTSLPQMPWAL